MDSPPVSEVSEFSEDGKVESSVLQHLCANAVNAFSHILKQIVSDTGRLEGILVSVSSVQRSEACLDDANGIELDEANPLKNIHQAVKDDLVFVDGHSRDIATSGFLFKSEIKSN